MKRTIQTKRDLVCCCLLEGKQRKRIAKQIVIRRSSNGIACFLLKDQQLVTKGLASCHNFFRVIIRYKDRDYVTNLLLFEEKILLQFLVQLLRRWIAVVLLVASKFVASLLR